jgi:hypothetical protein
MSAKHKKLKAPSWVEVGLGAFLSVVLGVALGAAYLVFKPVIKAKDIPKDAPSGAVYYLEGARDFTKSADADAARKTFADGGSVSVDEGELNMLLGESGKTDSDASKAPAKGAPAPNDKMLDMSSLNCRIRDGKIQFADTVSFNVFGITGSVIVQSTGEFDKEGSEFEFVPDTLDVGGCPLHRFPFIRGIILKKLLFAQPVPDDIAAAWSKLINVTIDGSTLHLRMP